MSVLPHSAVRRLRSALAESPVPDRYRLIEVIGEGGMGVVWRAHDSVLHRDVAVKLLAAHLADDGAAQRLAREARILATLEHPGIVPVFDAGIDDNGAAWYAMRLVNGVRLDRAARDGRTRHDLIRIVEQLCDTVAYAHAHGVLHRDLKPHNIMLGPFGEVLVLDWGVAGGLRDGASSGGTVVGTPGYMAPEQAAGETADERTDVYGLGAILGELLAVHELKAPAALHSIVARACATNRNDRYATPAGLRDDLRRFAAGERVLAHRETILERIARFWSTYQAAILLVLAYLLMRITILFWRKI